MYYGFLHGIIITTLLTGGPGRPFTGIITMGIITTTIVIIMHTIVAGIIIVPIGGMIIITDHEDQFLLL